MASEDPRVAELEAALARTSERARALMARGQAMAAELDQVRSQLADQAWRQPGRRHGQVAEFAALLEAEVQKRLAAVQAKADDVVSQAEAIVARELQQAEHSHATLLALARRELDDLRESTAPRAQSPRDARARRAREAVAEAQRRAGELRDSASKAALERRQMIVHESAALSQSAERETGTMRAVAEREAQELIDQAKREADELLRATAAELDAMVT
ncbi:MAG: hypothetical protein LBG60_17180, partial [Bifidobacteriaceae bacterium]|nr:hypothetical protein [Bifidobacteriaceae bacterium]